MHVVTVEHELLLRIIRSMLTQQIRVKTGAVNKEEKGRGERNARCGIKAKRSCRNKQTGGTVTIVY